MKIDLRGVVALLTLLLWVDCPAQTSQRQREYLEHLLRLMPSSPAWETWLQSSGELPPDFDALPTAAYLPDPLRFVDGRDVLSAALWPARRQELIGLFRRYSWGVAPPPPGNLRVAEDSVRQEGTVTVHNLTLEFGPERQGRLYLELYVPAGPGPFPVLLTTGARRGWAIHAVSRGYVGCAFAAGENRDDTLVFGGLWPTSDWTKLARRAWGASRVVDYLQSLGVVDRGRIALAGQGVDAKVALIAAATDERIGAVLLTSSGAGGVCPFRLFSESQGGEGLEPLTREHPDWFHPRLRFFVGRENKLPIDQNLLLACVAPRPCLLASALHDAGESVWAMEHAQQSAQRVYALLGTPGALALQYRPGGAATRTEDLESQLDWLDGQWGRRNLEVGHRRLFPTYADWYQASEERWDPLQYPQEPPGGLLVTRGGNPILTVEEWKPRRADILARVSWGLGIAPPRAQGSADTADASVTAALLNRDKLPAGLGRRSVTFGGYVPGDLYFPAGADLTGQKIPAVIWLHPTSSPTGYAPAWGSGLPFYHLAAQAGFAVLAFDQIGNGQRIEEVRKFYSRYPHWSLMGRTVQDVQAALDALHGVPFVDARRVFVVGYGTGGMAALHAAALDDRLAGVISIGGFTPLRTDPVAKGTGGIARWSHWLPLMPRLGAFAGQESRIPYDFHEVLAAIAPRPALVVAPALDYQSTAADVVACVKEAARSYALYKAESKLGLYAVNDYHRFSPETRQQVLDQLIQMLKLTQP